MRYLRSLSIALVAIAACSGCAKDDVVKYNDPCDSPPAPSVSWTRCSLRGADLRGADLSDAFLQGVDLSGADLTGANLSGASLTNVYADSASIFRDVNMRGALVNGGDIHLATYCNTTMPDGKVTNSGC